MEADKRAAKEYRSMAEFKRRFFPKESERKSLDGTADARTIGVNLARQSLERIRQGLKK